MVTSLFGSHMPTGNPRDWFHDFNHLRFIWKRHESIVDWWAEPAVDNDWREQCHMCPLTAIHLGCKVFLPTHDDLYTTAKPTVSLLIYWFIIDSGLLFWQSLLATQQNAVFFNLLFKTVVSFLVLKRSVATTTSFKVYHKSLHKSAIFPRKSISYW